MSRKSINVQVTEWISVSNSIYWAELSRISPEDGDRTQSLNRCF
jgi:phosphopantothenate synthetase